MKSLVLILVTAFSMTAFADENSGFETYALKCVNAKSTLALEFNSGRGWYADDSKETPLTIRLGSKAAKAEMYSYVNSEGTYVDNTETDQIHEITDMFDQGMVNAHGYDDKSQSWGALGRTFTLIPSKTMKTLDLPSPRFAATFSLKVEIREGVKRQTDVLKCQARMRSYGS